MKNKQDDKTKHDFNKLSYDSSTGVFVWVESPSKKIPVGSVAGTITRNGYCNIKIGKINYLAHRLAWLFVNDCWPSWHVDHINGDRLDNRISNLREASFEINAQNRRVANSNNVSCGLLGVSWNKGNKRWAAAIRSGGRKIHIGLFDTPDLAHKAYIHAKRELHPGCSI